MELALVPMHVDALLLTEPRAVIGPLAEFSRLPWSDGTADYNADRPWLGQSISRPCFEDPDTVLPAGVHLHWTLPDGLTRAAPGSRFPAAPDRWLIRRRQKGFPAMHWVVESDHFAPASMQADGIAYPVQPAQGSPPYARLGRAMPLADWLQNEGSAERIPVTAVGYGEATFAAFYPGCRSVFGFHDADVPTDALVTYDILGWHSRSEEDPLGEFLSEVEPQAAAEPAWTVLRRFNWRFSDLAADDYRRHEPPPPRRMLCYARLELSASGVLSTPEPPQIAIGDSGAEALAALAAHVESHSVAGRAGIEAGIDAVSLLPDFVHRTIDRPAAFKAARHERTFIAEEGGYRWALRLRRDGGAPASVDGAHRPDHHEPPPTLARHLDELNRLQAELDRAEQELASLRTRLFADWAKYMMCAYPTIDAPARLDLNDIRAFLEDNDLAEIHSREAEKGALDLRFDNEGSLVTSDSASPADTLSAQVAAEATRILRKAAVFNATGLSGQRDGDPALEVQPDGSGHLVFRGKTALGLDWIDGWGNWPQLGGGGGMLALTVWLRVRPDALQEADILSFDASAHFAVGLKKIGSGAVFTFDTAEAAGTPDSLPSPDPIVPRKWVDLIATYDHRDGVKRLWVDGKKVAERTLPNGPAIGGAAMRSGVLGGSSDGEALAAAPGKRRFRGAVARLALLPGRALSETEVADFIKRPRPAPMVLKREGAPRFWRPRDPVIMLRGPAAQASGRHQRGELRCHRLADRSFAVLNGDNRKAAGDVLMRAFDLIGRRIERTPDDAGLNRSDGAPWHPLMVEWETALHPVSARGPGGDGDQRYAEDYITSAFALEPDGDELRATSGSAASADRASITSGRVVLTPFAAHTFERRRRAAAEELGDQAHPVLATDENYSDTQSQALGGFHAALLQYRQGLGLPPDDPLAFADRRDFSRKIVRDAVGPQGLAAASPDQPFLPIRAGRLEIRRLRLIDAFGRILDVPAENIARPTRLMHEVHRNSAELPPRLSQPARLNFRWLSADRDVGETNDHPSTSPICGWVVTNFLDSGLQIFSADGEALGEISPDPDHPWRPVPGARTATQPERFDSVYLGRIARMLISQPPDVRDVLLDAIRASIDLIHPAPDSAPDAIGLIMGRPLAVVRASIDLQVRGLPAVNQDWGAFARDVRRRVRDDSGYTRVRFPVRLGERARLEDGLVGFWREDATGLPGGPFHAPAIEVGNAKLGLVGLRDEGFPLELTLADAPVAVTMLLDPMGAVHATSGILPVKSIRIPPEHYAAALLRIGTTILTAPVLAPGGRIALPLPVLPGFRWSWRERGPQGWREVGGSALAPPRYDAAFEGRTDIREGWLVLSRGDD